MWMRLFVSNCTADSWLMALFFICSPVSTDCQPFRPDRRGPDKKDARKARRPDRLGRAGERERLRCRGRKGTQVGGHRQGEGQGPAAGVAATWPPQDDVPGLGP